MNDQGELAAPTIYNGVMYVINGKWTFAIDVETGRQIWRTPVLLNLCFFVGRDDFMPPSQSD
jgi:outer membrane protein assembly factor BamB